MKKLEQIVKRIILRTLVFLSPSKRQTGAIRLDKSAKILCIRLNRIGDALVGSALINAIKKTSGCELWALASTSNEFVFRNNPDVDNLVVYEKNPRDVFDLMSRLNAEHFDAVIDLHDDLSTTVSFIINFLNSHYKVGLSKQNEILYTHTIERPPVETHHIIDRLLPLLSLLGLKTDPKQLRPRFYPSPAAVDRAREFLTAAGLPAEQLIGINISAGSDARFWGVEKYARLVTELRRQGRSVVVLSAEKDLEAAKEAAGEVPVFCSTAFEEFAALIQQLDVLITPDTAAVHLASVWNIPVFGLFVKDTPAEIWYPYNTPWKAAVTKEHALDSISYKEVAEGVREFLQTSLPAGKYN